MRSRCKCRCRVGEQVSGVEVGSAFDRGNIGAGNGEGRSAGQVAVDIYLDVAQRRAVDQVGSPSFHYHRIRLRNVGAFGDAVDGRIKVSERRRTAGGGGNGEGERAESGGVRCCVDGDYSDRVRAQCERCRRVGELVPRVEVGCAFGRGHIRARNAQRRRPCEGSVDEDIDVAQRCAIDLVGGPSGHHYRIRLCNGGAFGHAVASRIQVSKWWDGSRAAQRNGLHSAWGALAVIRDDYGAGDGSSLLRRKCDAKDAALLLVKNHGAAHGAGGVRSEGKVRRDGDVADVEGRGAQVLDGHILLAGNIRDVHRGEGKRRRIRYVDLVDDVARLVAEVKIAVGSCSDAVGLKGEGASGGADPVVGAGSSAGVA